MTFSRSFPLILAGWILASPVSAHAQTEATQKAKEYYDRGAALYFEGDYSRAVLEFMRAYDTLPEPVFLYNIALSHWRLGNLDKSIAVAEETLRHDGLDESLDATVKGRLVAVRRLRFLDTNTWTAPQTPDEEPPVAEVVETTVVPDEGGGFTSLGWTGVALTAAGAGLLAGFAVTEVGLQKKIEEYEAAASAGDGARYDELRGQIEGRQPLSLAFLWSGVAAAAVGVTLIVIDMSGDSEPAEVVLAPHGAALRWTW